MIKEPMLAVSGNIELDALSRYPYDASPKMDGFRGLVPEGKLMSRKFLAIPNSFVTKRFSRPEFSGLDGELVLGLPTGDGVMNRTARACSNHIGQPDVKLYVFDCFHFPHDPFRKRFERAMEIVGNHPDHLRAVLQYPVGNKAELIEFEQKAVDFGFEGVIIRAPFAPYKFGRSTEGEGYMMKWKREETMEALIEKVNQAETNMNPAMMDAFGKTKRSTAKSGKVLVESAGSYQCLGLNGKFKGVRFDCSLGEGVKQKDKDAIWKMRGQIEGKLVMTIKYIPYGSIDKPKSSRAVAPRPDWDFDKEAA